MQKVSIEDVESETYDPANRTHELRRLTDPLSASRTQDTGQARAGGHNP